MKLAIKILALAVLLNPILSEAFTDTLTGQLFNLNIIDSGKLLYSQIIEDKEDEPIQAHDVILAKVENQKGLICVFVKTKQPTTLAVHHVDGETSSKILALANGKTLNGEISMANTPAAVLKVSIDPLNKNSPTLILTRDEVGGFLYLNNFGFPVNLVEVNYVEPIPFIATAKALLGSKPQRQPVKVRLQGNLMSMYTLPEKADIAIQDFISNQQKKGYIRGVTLGSARRRKFHK
jgi:hypothetical protein